MLQRAESPSILAGYEAGRSFFAPCFAAAPTLERLWVAHVDDEARCIHLASYDSSLDADDLPIRDILGDAIRLDSAGIVLAHNHPGGDCAPSTTDRAATTALGVAAEAIELTVLDHLVFGDEGCASFRRMGLL
jgi:DNA repair protein RadC